MDYLSLSKTALFKDIPENKISSVISYLEAYEKEFKKSEIIYNAGDKITDMGLVISGGINIVVNYYWGSSNIFGHISPGEIFAETYAVIQQKELLCDVVAAENSTVLFMSVSKLFSSHRDSMQSLLIRNLLTISAQKNINLSSRMMHTASKFIRERLRSYFSEQAIISECNRFTIPFSRQELADYLGVERSALSNELSKMKRDGLIDFHKNSFILIKSEA